MCEEVLEGCEEVCDGGKEETTTNLPSCDMSVWDGDVDRPANGGVGALAIAETGRGIGGVGIVAAAKGEEGTH